MSDGSIVDLGKRKESGVKSGLTVELKQGLEDSDKLLAVMQLSVQASDINHDVRLGFGLMLEQVRERLMAALRAVQG